MEELRELNMRLEATKERIEPEEHDQTSYKPQFQSRRMRVEKSKGSPTKGHQVSLEYDD